MATPVALNTITFTSELGQTNPVYTFNDVFEDNRDLVATFTGQVVNDGCATDSPVIAANSFYDGPVFIEFSELVSAVSLDAGCFDARKSTRVVIYGDNDFKVETVFNPNDNSQYFHFNFEYGENVIRKVKIRPIGDEPSGFAVDNVQVTIRPESQHVTKSNNAEIDSLIADNKWADTTINWSFADSNSERPGYGTGPLTFPGSKMRVNSQDSLSAGQKKMVKTALGLWDDYANITFNKVPDGDDPGQLRFARANISANGDAFLPEDGARGGDVMIKKTAPTGEKPPGDYMFFVVVHEVGHALGLTHPHEADGEGTALPANQDSIETSIMSYRATTGASINGGVPGNGNNVETPMMNDIAAIQFLYGANFGHKSGDTTYKFDPNEAKIFRTIWDGGGTDTYDASDYTNGVILNLNPGSWSTLKKSQRAVLDSNGAGAADDDLAKGNVANALLFNGDVRSLIENAKGGSGNDWLFGNQTTNILTGRDGRDHLIGKGDDDILRGGRGRDWLKGGDGDDVLRGDRGRDTMKGGDGSDLFVFLDPRDGARQERIKDFTQGDDTIALGGIDANTNIAGDQAFSFIGDAAFTAAGQLRAISGGGDTLILGDVDGDGRTDFRLFLTGEMTLTAGDFLL